jgi:hypothetical protein
MMAAHRAQSLSDHREPLAKAQPLHRATATMQVVHGTTPRRSTDFRDPPSLHEGVVSPGP